MDINRAKEIVSILAEGIDPLTGEVLPVNHVCNQAEVVRAFYALLKIAENKKSSKSTYENAGKPWTTADDEELRRLFEAGVKQSEMCKHFGRSRGSITARLGRLGLIEQSWPWDH